MLELYSHQLEALDKMKNGCILCGDVGSGKSLTAISYYYLQMGGDKSFLTGGDYVPMDDILMKDLYIITTARKRDTNEWGLELCPFLLGTDAEDNIYNREVVIDSWNNIAKYQDIRDSFFIFDEQRVIGNGAWVKSFLKIARSSEWILLSATPGDTWLDYIPVFIANGFYRNRMDFINNHVIYYPHMQFPKVKKYFNEGRLIRLRNDILITMEDTRSTIQHHVDIYCEYNKDLYNSVYKNRWNPFDNCPVENPSQWAYLQRKVVNLDESREVAFLELLESNERAIIFYNYNYELERIRSIAPAGLCVAEWNGQKHQDIPDSSRWIFLVQYTAGSEGWNCTRTDCIIFWSENYSYRVMKQAAGRIDRINTKFKDLYYYHLKSLAPIDKQIALSLKRKKDFNARGFYNKIHTTSS